MQSGNVIFLHGHLFLKASKFVNDGGFLMMDQLKNEVQTQHGVVFRGHRGALQGQRVTGPVQHVVHR